MSNILLDKIYKELLFDKIISYNYIKAYFYNNLIDNAFLWNLRGMAQFSRWPCSHSIKNGLSSRNLLFLMSLSYFFSSNINVFNLKTVFYNCNHSFLSKSSWYFWTSFDLNTMFDNCNIWLFFGFYYYTLTITFFTNPMSELTLK